MKTMIWKELRENFKWALLALLGLTVAEFYTLSSGRSDNQDVYNNLTLCSSAFLLVTSFGCSVIGAALGVVQILPELRRDQWAALLHRPVSRSVIFFGKVLAGLLLYFFATLLPFLVSTVYVATPGQFPAPLVPGMMLPGLSDLFLGLVFYFAAILLCLHRGRWFGSRGLIGLSVLPVFLMHLTMGWPFLLPLLAALILLSAAWGTMLSNGQVQPRLWTARISFVIIVLTGAQTAWLILIFGLQFLPGKKPSFSSYTNFEITQDGQVFLSTQKVDGSASVLTDMEGKVITDERYVGNSGNQRFLALLPLSWDFRKESGIRDSFLSSEPRYLGNYVGIVQQSYDSKEKWYLLVRQNYFVGYDKLSRRCVGIFDREGFKPAGAVPQPFPIRLESEASYGSKPLLYWSGPQLYAFDLSERSMIPFFNARNDTIYGASNVFNGLNGDKPVPVAVALEKDVRIFDPQGKPLMTIPYGHDPALWSSIEITVNAASDRFYLQYEPDFWSQLSNPESAKEPVFLDEIDLQGNVLHTYSHPSNNSFTPPAGWVDLSTASSPLLPALLGTIYYHLFPVTVPAISFSAVSYPRPAFDVEMIYLAILFSIAVVLGSFTLIWARRVGFSGKRGWLWALFVFCFGLPGLLTFRLASNWPTQVRCPQCGRMRPIEIEECPCCHQPWPLPPPNGAEIFDFKKVEI